jgi:hypothetical protein
VEYVEQEGSNRLEEVDRAPDMNVHTPLNSSPDLAESSIEIDMDLPIYNSLIKSVYFKYRNLSDLPPLYYNTRNISSKAKYFYENSKTVRYVDYNS